MNFNISAISDAVISELVASVQGLAARADSRDYRPHGAQSRQAQSETRLRDATASVLKGTQELFPGDVSVEAVDDPEIPESRYLTVSCRSNQSVEEIMVAFNEWHRKLSAWAPGLEYLFRLSIDAME